jgi:hypothetical protein
VSDKVAGRGKAGGELVIRSRGAYCTLMRLLRAARRLSSSGGGGALEASETRIRPKRNPAKRALGERMFDILAGVADPVVASVEVPLERLEAQICEGAAHLAAGVGRWLLLVGDFDRRKGYERWECRSSAFWLNWHCGISVRTAQDQVRVGRALLDYPRIAEALCSGRLSYSKVRAITRVVMPETEATLIDLASAVPTSQIERVVAGRRRVDVLENATAHKVRYLNTYDDEDGSLVGMFRLDPDEGAALLAGLTLGKDVLRHQKRSAERSGAEEDPKPDADDCSPEAHTAEGVQRRCPRPHGRDDARRRSPQGLVPQGAHDGGGPPRCRHGASA